MNIVVISQMFPCRRHPSSAVFFANLMKELAPKVDRLSVVTPRPYFPRALSYLRPSLNKWRLDPCVSRYHGMLVIRPWVPSVPDQAWLWLDALLMRYGLTPLIRHLRRRHPIDLLLGYNMMPEGVATVGVAKSLRLPVGFWCIGSDVNDFAPLNRFNLRSAVKSLERSDLVLTESKDLERRVRGLTARSLPVRTFYKGIDVSRFGGLPPRETLVRQYGLPGERKYVLFAGRLIYDKGIYELASAFARVAARFSDVDLLLVGEEIERPALAAKLSRQGLAGRVLFRGLHPYSEMPGFMAVSHVLALPSWAEGLPNVVMEAMATGLPVVATNVGGIPEVLENEVTGLLVKPKDEAALFSALARMLQDQALREKCARNSKALIRARFDVRQNVQELVAVITDLVNKQRCGLRTSAAGEIDDRI